jgi:hypothetical protein
MNGILPGDHEPFRRALHAAAEQLEPTGDGLARIKARISHRRPMPWPIAWIDVALTRLSLRIPEGVWSAWDKVALQLKSAFERFLPAPARALSGRLGWMRPVAAMSVAVFIVAAVVYMAIEVPQAVYPQAALSPTGHGARTGGSASGSVPGQSLTNGGSAAPGQSPTSAATNRTACPTTRPTITPAPSTSTSGQSPSQSTSPSPSSSTSPSPSSSPSPSTSASGSTAPSGSGDSPNIAPSDSPSSGGTGDAPATTTVRVSGSKAKPIQHSTTGKPSATPSASCSQRPSSKPKSTVNASPDAAGALLLLAPEPGLSPAEVGGRTY